MSGKGYGAEANGPKEVRGQLGYDVREEGVLNNA